MKLSNFHFLLFTFVILIFNIGCHDESTNENKTPVETTPEVGVSKVVKVEKVIFSVPSPIQISILIKKSGANYHQNLIQSTSRASDYSTNFSRGLTLGVYGADLGYCSIYDQSQDAIADLNGIKKLADALQISSSFDMTLFERFKNNLGKKDSLLAMITDAFRNSDTFLKREGRNEISTYVLTGGWIEAMHLMTQIVKENGNQELTDRIGDQKNSLDNLLLLLQPYSDQKEIKKLIDSLTELKDVYDELPVNYTYHPSTHDPSKKITIINSESKISVTKAQMERITQLVNNIHKGIIL